MSPIARFAAPRAAFLSVVGRCSHLVLLLGLAGFSTLSIAATLTRDCGDARPVPGRFIVRAQVAPTDEKIRLDSVKPPSLVEKLLQEKPSRLIHRTTAHDQMTPTVGAEDKLARPAGDNSVVTVASDLSDADLKSLEKDSAVLSIEQDCLIHISAVPNDPVPAASTFIREALNLEKAWDLKTDSSNVVVAVSDTGVDLLHPDLQANLWTNTIEANGQTGVDDDGNGCIDDVHGCDFGDYDGDPSPFSDTEGDHGTHVAGIIGALGNNGRGAVGVSWSARLMPVKGFDTVGNALVSDLLKTVYYSVNNGARVVNCSWGANRKPTPAEIEAFQYALSQNVLPVVAAGNSSIDASQTSPAGIDGVFTVGSINSLDQVSGFSNFGPHVAVYAPGGDALSAGGSRDEFIYSTIPTAHGSYGSMRGTSMAAPFVSGLAALVFSVNPKFSAADVKNIILSTSRRVTSTLPDGSRSEIRIPDAEEAIKLAATFTPTAITNLPSTKDHSPAPENPSARAAGSPPDSSPGCSAKREGAPGLNWMSLVLIFVPLCWTLLLREKRI